MALSDLSSIVDLTETIVVNEKVSFHVRGLATIDFAVLMNKYGKSVDGIFEGNLNLPGLLAQAPDMVVQAIALAADEPEQIETIAKLPMGIQLEALKKIYELTFPDEDFMGKLVEQVTEVIQKLRDKLVLESQKSPEKDVKETGE